MTEVLLHSYDSFTTVNTVPQAAIQWVKQSARIGQDGFLTGTVTLRETVLQLHQWQLQLHRGEDEGCVQSENGVIMFPSVPRTDTGSG